jgi:hypothetical protein
VSLLARYRARIALVALLVLAVWEIGVLWSAKAKAASDTDWRLASEALGAMFQKGDLIVVAPAWADPVARKWLGALVTLDDVARMDAARYARLWEISVRGERAPETQGAKLTWEKTYGAVRVRLYTQEPASVVWDLRPRSRLLEVGFEPKMCVPLQTLDAITPEARLTLDRVTLGTELVVYAGLYDFRSRRDNRARALLRVLLDDAEVSRAVVDNESGFAALPVVPTHTGTHRLTFEASVDPSSPANEKVKLDVCVAAEARL